MENSNEDVKTRLERLVSDLCSSGKKILDEHKLKEFKNICKSNDEWIKTSFYLLNNELNKEHSEIRYSALQLTDCLFQRSHVFRELILEDFKSFFDLVLETDPEFPLPPPKKAANELKILGINTIKNWNDKFSSVYKLLELGFNYLKNCKKIDFVKVSHQTNAQRAHIERINERQQIVVNKKYLDYVKEMKENEADIEDCIRQLEHSINILIPKSSDLFGDEDFNTKPSTSAACDLKSLENNLEKYENDKNDKNTPDIDTNKKDLGIETKNDAKSNDNDDDEDDEDYDDDDFVEVKTSIEQKQLDEEIELRYLGFLNDRGSSYIRNYNLQLNIGINETDENKIVINIMRDLYKELNNSHLERINTWIKNFNSVRNIPESGNSLKRAIELKNCVKNILKKFTDLNIPINDSDRDKLKSAENESKNSDIVDKPGTSLSLDNQSNEAKDSPKKLDYFESEKEKKKTRTFKNSTSS